MEWRHQSRQAHVEGQERAGHGDRREQHDGPDPGDQPTERLHLPLADVAAVVLAGEGEQAEDTDIGDRHAGEGELPRPGVARDPLDVRPGGQQQERQQPAA